MLFGGKHACSGGAPVAGGSEHMLLLSAQEVGPDARAQLGRLGCAEALCALGCTLVCAARDGAHKLLLEEACLPQQALQISQCHLSQTALHCKCCVAFTDSCIDMKALGNLCMLFTSNGLLHVQDKRQGRLSEARAPMACIRDHKQRGT